MRGRGWEPVLFEDLVEFHDRYRIPLSKMERDGRPGAFPYYGAQGIIDWIDGYIFDGRYLLIAEDGENLKSRKQPVAYMAEGQFWVNNHAHVVKAVEGVADDDFLRIHVEFHPLNGLITGAAQPKLSQSNLKRLPVIVPPYAEQVRIGTVIRAVDGLIQNNRRRIAILEEMARLLYREWFVHFRFPGHEDVELEDSDLGPIPKDWDIRSFADLAEFVNGFAFKPSHWLDDGLPIVKIKELKGGVTADTPRYHGTDIDKRYFIDDGAVLFSWSADLEAYVWASGPALLNQHLFDVRPHEVSHLFIFHSLSGRMNEFLARAQGTTMKHIKRSALSEVKLALPPVELRGEFESMARPMLDLQLNLSRQNVVLREARDLLLPRLVSGELDVSELDLALGAAGV